MSDVGVVVHDEEIVTGPITTEGATDMPNDGVSLKTKPDPDTGIEIDNRLVNVLEDAHLLCVPTSTLPSTATTSMNAQIRKV